MIEVEQDRRHPKKELEYTHDRPVHAAIACRLKELQPGLFARYNKRFNRWEIWRGFVNDRPDTRLLSLPSGQPIDQRTYDTLHRGMWLARKTVGEFLAELDESEDQVERQVDGEYNEAAYAAQWSLQRWY